MSRIWIKNGMVYDGLGNAPLAADVLVEGDRIARIRPREARETCEDGAEAGIGACADVDPAGAPGAFGGADVVPDRVIDAAGRAVTPGFIDMHRHCDIKPFYGPQFGDCMLAQGITTTVVGNCGISMTPCSPDPKKAKEMWDFDDAVLGPACPGIHTYHDYLAGLERCELPLNMAAMIGTGSVKITVKGFSDTPFTEAEMSEARNLVEQAMEEGAPGVSAGIMYLPECYSTTEEFARLLEPVGAHGRVAAFHIRGEGDSMVDSVREVIAIGKQAGCAVEISHFKSCGMKNWKKEIHRAIGLIDAARAEGQDVTVDFYPYEGGSTALTTMLPPAFVAGDLTGALKRLGTPEGVGEFRRLASVEYDDWDNFCITLGWDRILISGAAKEHNRKFLGMNVAEAAAAFGYEDAYELAAYLMHDEDGKTAIINMSMCQEDIDTVARLPYSMVISDSIYAETDTPHPRMYGSFPKIIREYVQERGILTLSEALKKMTSMPAARMGILDRGVLKEGMFADINIFDPKQLKDHATFQNPTELATGLDCCLINGVVVYENGNCLERGAGRVIRGNV